MTNRYFWLRLQSDFFTSKRIKKLRKLAGGDTYTIIYLKMQLKSVKTNGFIPYTGIESTFAEEVALDIDEDVDNVEVTINYLMNVGLLEEVDGGYEMPYVLDNLGSESASTQRSREHRARVKMLQCNTNATELQQDATQVQQLCNVEKRREEKSREDIEKSIYTPTPKKKKSKYGDYKNVMLTDDEYQKIIAMENGEELIEFLDEYIERKGYKAKSHYLCLRGWVSEAVSERKKKVINNQNYKDSMEIADKEVEEFRRKLKEKESKC